MTVYNPFRLPYRSSWEQWAPGFDPTPPIQMEANVAPTAGLLDNFNTGGAQNLTARTGWGTGKWNSGDGTFATDATPTYANNSNVLASNMWAAQFTADQEVYITEGSVIAQLILILRGSSASTAGITAGYIARIGAAGALTIERYNATVLASVTVEAPLAGDQFSFQAIGSVLTIWRKQASQGVWTQMLMATDATYASAGYIGIAALAGSSPRIDDFGGGSIPVSTVVSDSGTVSFAIATAAQVPNQAALDTFNAGALQALTARAGWGAGHNKTGDASFTTDAAPTYANEGGGATSNIWGTQFSADQESIFTVGTVADTTGAIVRANAAGSTPLTGAYEFSYGWNGGWGLYPANSSTPIASGAGGSWPNLAAGDQIALQAIGSWLHMWRKPSAGSWTLMASVQDTVTAGVGYAGMSAVSGSTGRVDSFAAGPVALPSGSIVDSGTVTFAVAPNPGGAVTVVSQQFATNAATDVTTTITPTGITPGNTLIVIMADAGGLATGAVTSVTDTGGNTYTLPVSTGISGVTNTRLGIAYVTNCVAPGTITVNHGSIANRSIILLEVSGLLNAAHDDVQTDNTAAAATATVVPAVTMTAADFALAVVSHGGTTEDTPSAGWQLNTSGQPTSTAPIVRAAWQKFSASGSSGTMTMTRDSRQATAAMLAFKPSTTVATPSDTIVDAGTCTVGVSQTSVETVRDAVTVTMVVPETAAEQIQEPTATQTFVVSETATEAWPDAGTCILVVSETAAETQQDLATNTLVVSETATQTINEAATQTFVVLPTEVEKVVDAGSQTFVISETASETVITPATAIYLFGSQQFGSVNNLNTMIGHTALAGDVLTVVAVGGADGDGLGQPIILDNIDTGGTTWIKDDDHILDVGTEAFRVTLWRKICVGGENQVFGSWPGNTNMTFSGALWVGPTQGGVYLIGSGTGTRGGASNDYSPGPPITNAESYVALAAQGRATPTAVSFTGPTATDGQAHQLSGAAQSYVLSYAGDLGHTTDALNLTNGGGTDVPFYGAFYGNGPALFDQGTCEIAITQGDTTGVLDNFNRGASQNLSARYGWAAGVYWSSETTLATDVGPQGAIVPALNAWKSNYWLGSLGDSEVWFSYGAVGSGGVQKVIISSRGSGMGGSPSDYELEVNLATGAWSLDKYVSGTPTNLGAGTFATHAVGDSYKLRSIGSVHTVWYRPWGGAWALQATYSDAANASGVLAIQANFTTTSGNITDFGGGGVATPAVENVTDAGTCTFVVAPSDSESIVDAATQTAVFSFTATESVSGGTISDSGTVTLVVAETATEQLQDVGANAFVIAETDVERDNDQGTVTFSLSQTASEAPTDAATQTIGISQTGAEVPGEAATNAFSLTEAATEQLRDAGTVAFAVAETETDTPSDAGTCTLAVTQTAAETLREDATATFVVLPTSDGIDVGTGVIVIASTAAEQIQEAATCTFAVVSSAAEQIQEPTGALTLVVVPSQVEGPAEIVTQTAVVSQTAAEQLRDVGTVTMQFPEVGVERDNDAGTVTFGVATTGGEQVSDAGTASFAVSETDVESLVLADVGTAIVGVVQSAGETLTDVGTGVALVTETAAERGSDLGTALVVLAPTGGDTLADAGTALVGVALSAVESVTEAATCVLVASSSAAETIRDAVTNVAVIAPSGAETAGDIATVAFAVTSTAGEQFQAAAAASFVVLPATVIEGIVFADAGTVTFGITPSTAAEGVSQAATQTMVVVPSGAEAPADAATVTLTLLQTEFDNVIYAGTVTFGVDGTAAEQIRADPASGVCTFVVLPSLQYGWPDAGTVTFAVIQSYVSGDVGFATITVAPGSVATQQLKDADTFVFAISERAATTGQIDISGATPVTQDAGRRLRLRDNLARSHARQTANAWRRDRQMR